MGKIWLTYAWADNEDNDFDYIVSALKEKGLEVVFDKVHIIPGQRLWQQIDKGIMDPSVDAWGIYVTENSLKSEPCLEEIAYALDRTLRSKGSNFPLIGLFPKTIDREVIPSALATRLYVNLRMNDWAEQVVAGVTGVSTSKSNTIEPYGYQLHQRTDGYLLEVWPRVGHWSPSYAIVKEEDREKLTSYFCGVKGSFDDIGMFTWGEGVENGYFVRVLNNLIDSVTVAKISFSELPEWIEFGPANGQRYRLDLRAANDLCLNGYSLGLNLNKP